jgi:hypothetical protein
MLPLGRLSQRAAWQNHGEVVVVYLVAVGAAVAVAFLIVTPH